MLRPGWQRNMWLLVSIIDLLILYCLWARLLHFLGYTIIFDRYVEDTELDFSRNFPGLKVSGWLLWRFLLLLAPRVRCHFLLIVPTEVSAYRSIEKHEPFPDSLETLEWRYIRYCQMADKKEWCLLDGRNSITIVHQKIISLLGL